MFTERQVMRHTAKATRGTALIGGLALVAALGVPMTLPATAAPQLSPTSASGFTYNIEATIPVGIFPEGIAYLANAGDDSVYVTNSGSSTISVINTATNTVDDTINATRGLANTSLPVGIAVGADDTIYVALFGIDRLAVINPMTNTVDDSQPVFGSAIDPWSVAVFGDGTGDDTIYVANQAASVSVFDAVPFDEESNIDLPGVTSLRQIAAYKDETVFVTNFTPGTISVISGATQTLDDTITVGGNPSGIAATAGDLIYVANNAGDAVWAINAATGSIDDTITVGAEPTNLAYDSNFNRLYVANDDDSTVSVINTLTNTVDTTITGITHPEAITVSPDGTRVYVTSAITTATGFVTVISVTAPTPPTPGTPPGAPTDVMAEAGDARATVSWTAPTSVGSFPISDYQVLSSPDARTCLVASPATTCEVTGLTNGTTYTFTVRALNGAGWGSYSTPSAPVTPNAEAKKSIQIIGSRDASDTRRVVVNGVTTGLVGAQVRPFIRFPGQSGYSPGTGVRTVAEDGTFRWQRRTGKKIYVYFTSGDVRSERVIIAAR
jgi:YVTN family beta-propeller protein